ncbi:hypothetical protein PPTG_24789 [Phytophthora nicotianae INRA-310]|uniref:Uncharacterized protein n=1 Tax=Phytophthora nicotianae (strain INRA-310) TaxID=761204 RepID=W2PCH4_PHYN3|nr:hypothetical protein PPTG_24789 [Phytophthora nicotianae INRA-310]ETM97913.1 hypothetical protein PPTG_24789 [Phytophthora nicotianae INRA-310]
MLLEEAACLVEETLVPVKVMTTAQVFPTGYAQKCIARINE